MRGRRAHRPGDRVAVSVSGMQGEPKRRRCSVFAHRDRRRGAFGDYRCAVRARLRHHIREVRVTGHAGLRRRRGQTDIHVSGHSDRLRCAHLCPVCSIRGNIAREIVTRSRHFHPIRQRKPRRLLVGIIAAGGGAHIKCRSVRRGLEQHRGVLRIGIERFPDHNP